MSELIDLRETPIAESTIMLAGWRQWADAGNVSSGLPERVIEITGARKIGDFMPGGYYLFQIPGAHHLLRPAIKLEEGYRQELEEKRNEIYYSGDEEQGLVIFLGDEPHLNETRYADAFFAVADALNVKHIAGTAGVYGEVPYDKDRLISCIYSLPHMKEELEGYALNFSNYEGGASIGSYLVHEAEGRNMPYVALYAIVPAYDFGGSSVMTQGVRIENDYRAWNDILQRLNSMFQLGLDLTALQQQGEELTAAMDSKIEELAAKLPGTEIRDYLDKVAEAFTELSYVPLDDIWEAGLKGLFEDLDNN